ncbi:zinc finger protein 33B isoform X1 [Manduca sexta]|uniref:zinc finger protein 33B isoform X1 n=1 Tax=Manduca sexta TaxID=7130 RepID=UPI00188F03B2|nr:zinc finger protein 33B isoform X1 [Manduca sexta]
MKELCRLCMGSELLMDILTLDGETNIGVKAASCIGIQISPNDGLSSKICKTCKEMVTIFFNFKQKCMDVDLKLRTLASSALVNKNLDICSQKPSQHNKITDLETAKSNIINNENSTIQGFDKSIPKKKFQCEICGRIFKMKAGLENHIITHSGLKPYPCKLCPKRYCRIESLTIHMRSHAGIKPYVCEICGKTSTKPQDLIRHMKIHSEERNYACPRCDRHFKRGSDVTSHMRTHTGSRPYGCETCKKTYTSHSGLRKHYKSHCKRGL